MPRDHSQRVQHAGIELVSLFSSFVIRQRAPSEWLIHTSITYRSDVKSSLNPHPKTPMFAKLYQRICLSVGYPLSNHAIKNLAFY
ncbi:hypothetical protein OPQ81_001124 [Rhizoctonia solani]|nr:hypothetical protein OPQ81_001124 [Rhizoctonia solani]